MSIKCIIGMITCMTNVNDVGIHQLTVDKYAEKGYINILDKVHPWVWKMYTSSTSFRHYRSLNIISYKCDCENVWFGNLLLSGCLWVLLVFYNAWPHLSTYESPTTYKDTHSLLDQIYIPKHQVSICTQLSTHHLNQSAEATI